MIANEVVATTGGQLQVLQLWTARLDLIISKIKICSLSQLIPLQYAMFKINYNIPLLPQFAQVPSQCLSSCYDSLEQAAKEEEWRKRSLLCVFLIRMRVEKPANTQSRAQTFGWGLVWGTGGDQGTRDGKEFLQAAAARLLVLQTELQTSALGEAHNTCSISLSYKIMCTEIYRVVLCQCVCVSSPKNYSL